MRRALAHLVGIAAFTAIGVPVGILYIVIVGRVLDRGGDGFGLTAAISSTFVALTFAVD